MSSNAIAVRGKLGTGIECKTLTTTHAVLYSLIGNLGGFKDGDYVEVAGTIADFSPCMQGKATIVVAHIAKIPAAKKTSNLVHEIDTVSVQVLFSLPPQYSVHCVGIVTSAGWKNPRLTLLTKGTPADGIYDVAFEADPPSKVSTPALTSIPADKIFNFGHTARVIRVHSATNTKSWPATE